MNTIIVVFLLVCGQIDTVIIKHPNKNPTYTHGIRSQQDAENLLSILRTKPIIIKYQDGRGRCI